MSGRLNRLIAITSSRRPARVRPDARRSGHDIGRNQSGRGPGPRNEQPSPAVNISTIRRKLWRAVTARAALLGDKREMRKNMAGIFSVRAQKGTLPFVAMAFLLGVAGSRAYDRYTRVADCKRWHENVTRWVSLVADAPGELTHAETTALTLARGGMIAVRNQMCGNDFP
jgi:hypothetical protein